ncbi:MAG TPA: CBS domain-containing protein [Burkholderiales bacterium]|nr:CBS domain-containing protein [Burkholderiales bacterium]
MLGLPIKSVLEPRKLVVAAPHTTVAEAARLMKEGKVGAVLVVEEGRLVGIFTERDALFRVIAPGLDPAKTELRGVMTRDPTTVAPDETFGYALLLMHDKGFRHTPVVENGRPVGVVSARHALDPDLEEFTAEAERRRAIRRRA